jgi:hypothetical protein
LIEVSGEAVAFSNLGVTKEKISILLQDSAFAFYKILAQSYRIKFVAVATARHTGGAGVQLYSFFNLDPRWDEWLTPRPGRFIPDKKTWYPLNRRLAGLQSLSSQFRLKENLLPLSEFEPRNIQPVWIAAVATELSRLTETKS